MATPSPIPSSSAMRPLRAGGFLLGFALGGFFDGILLHQVLQWHHFLSNVDAARDIRTQILADGLFHILMYFVAAFALLKVWRARKACAEPGAGRLLRASALLGFCAWQFADVVLAHWVVGIHRVRVGVPDPLLWDLGWLFVFGVVPLLFFWRPRRGNGGGGDGRRAAATLGIAVLLAGPLALWPTASDADGGPVMVMFTPGTSSAAAFNALASVDARVLWVDGSGGLWAVSLAEPARAQQLYGRGALLVSNASFALGCFSSLRPPP